MKLLFLCTLFQLEALSFPNSLPPTDSLYAALDAFYQQRLMAELSAFQTTHEKDWLKYLPTVGLSYTFDGKPRPTASWSSTLIYTSQKNKESQLAKQQAIIYKNQLSKFSDLIKLENLIREYDFLLEDLDFLESIYSIDQQLFKVKEDQALAMEIGPVELLKAKKDIKKKAYEILIKKREILKMESEILQTARFSTL